MVKAQIALTEEQARALEQIAATKGRHCTSAHRRKRSPEEQE